MTGDESGPPPEPDEYLERVLWEAFREACATMRRHGSLPGRVRAHRPPEVAPVGTFPDIGASDTLRELLARVGAECVVYVHESRAPRGTAGQDTGRLVVAAAVWPGEGLSGLRVSSYRSDGTLEEITAEGVRLEDTHLDVPWLRGCLPGSGRTDPVTSPHSDPAPTPDRSPGPVTSPMSAPARIPRAGAGLVALALVGLFGCVTAVLGVIGLLAGTWDRPTCGGRTMTPGDSCVRFGSTTTYEERRAAMGHRPDPALFALGGTAVMVACVVWGRGLDRRHGRIRDAG
ncbi:MULTISPECIES: hypothetical protein [unclassified Streptomyces]|uniref:hypothetical protein n=1 Tax=unclassified Streptomyces TaxID=2593676 RepID=UPI003713A7DA